MGRVSTGWKLGPLLGRLIESRACFGATSDCLLFLKEQIKDIIIICCVHARAQRLFFILKQKSALTGQLL
jgi:hypothetical protein